MACGRADRVRASINTTSVTYYYYMSRINYKSSVCRELAGDSRSGTEERDQHPQKRGNPHSGNAPRKRKAVHPLQKAKPRRPPEEKQQQNHVGPSAVAKGPPNPAALYWIVTFMFAKCVIMPVFPEICTKLDPVMTML